MTDPADIAALATDALLRELHTWPKPGLVSPLDNGSHSDMDMALLSRSALSLQPYFAQLARAGACNVEMSQLRCIGLAAERAMLRVTAGINTHRGAIFGLGLLCAAAGHAIADQELGHLVQRRWGLDINPPHDADASHGAAAWRRHGMGGARAEAAGGFWHLYQVGWPALRRGRLLARGDEAAARVQCCFALMARLDDTNLLHRGGLDGLALTRTLAADFIERGGVGCADWRAQALKVHETLVARRLSPGGSADLLAMTLFIDALGVQRAQRRAHCCREREPVQV
jgi:triphosphoribosyl-dephospho-CoA synthase